MVAPFNLGISGVGVGLGVRECKDGSDRSREETRGGLDSRVRGLDLMQNQWELVGKIESHLFFVRFSLNRYYIYNQSKINIFYKGKG